MQPYLLMYLPSTINHQSRFPVRTERWSGHHSHASGDGRLAIASTFLPNVWPLSAISIVTRLTTNERLWIVVCSLTTQNNTMKMTAQLFPLYPNESREVRLELFKNRKWEGLQCAESRIMNYLALVLSTSAVVQNKMHA